MQAAILSVRLARLNDWTARRRQLARRYRQAIAGGPVDLPVECDAGHVYHLFVVRSRDRRRLQASLTAQGVETLVHYPIPIPRQPAFAAFAPAACPIAARVCDEIVSLPLHPRMTDDDVATVAEAVLKGQ